MEVMNRIEGLEKDLQSLNRQQLNKNDILREAKSIIDVEVESLNTKIATLESKI